MFFEGGSCIPWKTLQAKLGSALIMFIFLGKGTALPMAPDFGDVVALGKTLNTAELLTKVDRTKA